MEKPTIIQPWSHQPQEQPGDYFFDGKIYVTRGVADQVPTIEIGLVLATLKQFVQQENGADYLQTFVRQDGLKVFVIDQLSKSMKESGQYLPEQIEEYNYATIMFAEEY